MSEQIAVLGAGLAGLAAAQRARERGCAVELYERHGYVGGHAASHQVDGFTFDEGPHVSFTRRPEIRELFERAVDGDFLEHRATITNYWRGHEIRHPAQTNLYGLPTDVVQDCIVGFVKARYEEERPVETYADWCHQGLGRAFSEEFTFRYTRKYWTIEAANMSTDWVGARMYPPRLEEVVRGALAPSTENHHYMQGFRYPRRGGFGAYLNAVSAGQEVHLGHDLASVDLRSGTLEFTGGQTARFETLVSSLPLPELVRRIKDVPAHVARAAERLVCTSLVLVNVGLGRSDGFPDAHWMYSYDEDTLYSRINLPHRLSPYNAPEGCGSIQVEVYHSRYRPLPCDDVLGRTMDDLVRNGLVEKGDDVRVAQAQHIAYANVLFDLERARSLAVVRAYLDEQGVICCGRYGEWAYLWTDDSIVSGWAAAERAAAAQPAP
jgi:protoporphyrinogen oxidase